MNMDTTIAHRAPHPVVAWIRRWTSDTRPAYARRALERAITRAYERFALEHPRWVDSLFDQHFLLHYATPVLARLLDATARVEPFELANAWLAQWASPTRLRAHNLAELTIAAGDFLSFLEDELQPYRAGGKAVQRRTSDGDDSPTGHDNAPTSWVLSADEMTRIHTLYAQSIGEDSNYEMDWLWLASQLPPSVERRDCLERALSINLQSEYARRELAKLPSSLTSIS